VPLHTAAHKQGRHRRRMSAALSSPSARSARHTQVRQAFAKTTQGARASTDRGRQYARRPAQRGEHIRCGALGHASPHGYSLDHGMSRLENAGEFEARRRALSRTCALRTLGQSQVALGALRAQRNGLLGSRVG